MGWWVRRSAARSTRRGCRSKPAAGNGWRWGWCWWSLKPGSGFDCPGLGGGRWGCERTDQQLVWQTARLPAPGMSVWCTHGCVCVCVCVWVRKREFMCNRLKLEDSNEVSKKRSQINTRPDAQADKHQTCGDRERMGDKIRQMEG